jgi:large subunit ribosomal protein L29
MAEEKRRTLLDRLRSMTDQELANEIAQMRHRLFDLRTKNVTRQLDNTASLAQTKKQIARLLTLQKERQMTHEKE